MTSRSGQPLKAHNSEQCEACQKGVCGGRENPPEPAPRSTRRIHHHQHRRLTFLVSKKDKATCITPEKQAQLLANPLPAKKAQNLEKNMLALCFQLSTKCTMFGSITPGNKREVVIFRSLRCTATTACMAEGALRSAKSCGDIVQICESFTQVEISD